VTLGLEQNPQVNVPIVTITVPYPGASAESVEESVTRPIEDAVAGLGGIKTITSNSQTSVAVITVEFEDGTDVDVAASDVQQRVSGVRSTLPPEVEDPSYAKLDFNDIPILNLAVAAEARPTRSTCTASPTTPSACASKPSASSGGSSWWAARCRRSTSTSSRTGSRRSA